MNEVDQLISEVAAARKRVLESVTKLTEEQGSYKPAPDRWSVSEILEHLVLAEQGGINYIWRAAEGFKKGELFYEGDSPNKGLPIEEIIQRTWKPNETAPESAAPRMGGPLAYWIAALEACQPVLEQLGDELKTLNLSKVIFPHFLCGPLDARQRLEFLRFHLDRHFLQIKNLKNDPTFSAPLTN